MAREVRPFVFELQEPENPANHLNPSQRTMRIAGTAKKIEDPAKKGFSVTFTDAEFGQLVRYMTRYGGGGFEARLYRAFFRSIYDLLATRVVL